MNGDGRPDLFVAGYTEANAPIPGSMAGFPTNHLGVRDLLFLNEGNGPNGRARFREVGAGRHRPGAVRPLARRRLHRRERRRPARPLRRERRGSEPPLRQRAAAGPLGFRFVDRARSDGRRRPRTRAWASQRRLQRRRPPDLFVTNSRGQSARRLPEPRRRVRRRRGRVRRRRSGRTSPAGAPRWVDLNNDGRPDLVLANGAIPVTNLAQGRAGRSRCSRTSAARSRAPALVGLDERLRVNGRGVAAADFDNDGHVDVAVNSVGGRSCCSATRAASGHWLEVELPRFAPGRRRDRHAAGRPAARRRRCTRARATSRPRIRASTSGSASDEGRRADGALSRTARRTTSATSRADRIVTSVPLAPLAAGPTCTRRTTVSNVTASSRIAPVTM